MSIDIEKEYYYFIKYKKIKLKNEYQKKLSIIADKVTRKQIQDEYRRKCEELRENHKEEYEEFICVRARKRAALCFLYVF